MSYGRAIYFDKELLKIHQKDGVHLIPPFHLGKPEVWYLGIVVILQFSLYFHKFDEIFDFHNWEWD